MIIEHKLFHCTSQLDKERMTLPLIEIFKRLLDLRVQLSPMIMEVLLVNPDTVSPQNSTMKYLKKTKSSIMQVSY